MCARRTGEDSPWVIAISGSVGVKNGTLDNDFRRLSSVVNTAVAMGEVWSASRGCLRLGDPGYEDSSSPHGSDGMTKTAAVLGMVTVLAIWVTTPVGAQELKLGTWTGTMSPPGNQSVDVSYVVGETDGALSIMMSVPSMPQRGGLAFNDVELDDDELTFWWEPGGRVDCTLLRQEDGSFEGTCSDGSADGDGILKMVPPSGEDRS